MNAIPSEWGFCLAGNEVAFCTCLEKAVNEWGARPAGDYFDYLEIGVGNGTTLRAVSQFLTQFEGLPWRLTGVDLDRYGGDATNAQQMGRFYAGVGSIGEVAVRGPSTISICLVGAAEFLKYTPQRFDFVFIDGCHGKPCVTRDFLGAEPLVKPGGFVMFHDTDAMCQGHGFQPHCGTGIDARAACQELGLFDDTRPGWVKVVETTGDKSKWGHGSLWVQKMAMQST